MGLSFDSVLVANRGEIAVRVLRTARAMGYRTVAVYSDADADAPHVAMADVAVRIGPPAVSESYLNIERVLDAARRAGAGAIHPGYGFLSENAAFAEAVVDAGLVWVGPPPSAIEAMGDKARSKARMLDSGVPCVPGFMGDHPSDEDLIAAAGDVGFPLLVKASAGGGGRGMRRAHGPEELAGAIRSARAEAANAFGDDTLLLERLVLGGRHVEVQVMADTHGHVIHLGERDCSVQRRHQKVIEEAPSPAVGPELRARMGEAACQAARAVGYVGAGTVEFLLGEDGAFYFLEMNTRLQVEHPVTEEVTGLDLVELQLRVAAGERLPIEQSEVSLEGHAIEVRLYAEDPAKGYLPQPGPVHCWEPPPGIRVDSGLSSSGEISAHYDPMVAKLIAFGRDRDEARRKMLRALEDTVFFGVRTNRDLLRRILEHPTFAQGQATTDFLGAHPGLADDADTGDFLRVAAVALALGEGDGFRSAHTLSQPISLSVDGVRLEGCATAEGVRLGENTHSVQTRGTGRWVQVCVDGLCRRVQRFERGSETHLRCEGDEVVVAPWDFAPDADADGADGRITMPMAGQVLAVDVRVGDRVEAGQVVAIVEAMKLETRLVSPVAGVVEDVRATVGSALPTGALVVQISEETS